MESKESSTPVVCCLLGSRNTPAYDIVTVRASADEETVRREGLLAAQVAGIPSAQALPQQAGWSEG